MRSGRRIVRIDGATLTGTRPRAAGANARLGPHGASVAVPIIRITVDSGQTGFGRSRSTPDDLTRLIGLDVADAFVAPDESVGGLRDEWRGVEFALWDTLGVITGDPVWKLVAQYAGAPTPLHAPTVRTYDTSLYFDDLHLTDHEAGAALIADEARQGWDRGHRAFKMKVGRGGKHLGTDAGRIRDVAAIRAVRTAIGPDAPLMIDANNGYTFTIARQVLDETGPCHLHWIEEAFHEDPVLYRDLRKWLDDAGLPCLIADGEGLAAGPLLDWAHEGLVQVIQYDIFGHGLTAWMRTGRTLDGWGVQTAPHHYGAYYGNMASGHLATAVRNFAFVEWDSCTVPGIDDSAYQIVEGAITLPNRPGFGLVLDEEGFAVAVAAGGFTIRT